MDHDDHDDSSFIYGNKDDDINVILIIINLEGAGADQLSLHHVGQEEHLGPEITRLNVIIIQKHEKREKTKYKKSFEWFQDKRLDKCSPRRPPGNEDHTEL